MTYKEFRDKWLGKPIDWDGSYGRQCVDVYRQYCNDIGFKQSPGVVGAKDIWNSYLKTDFDRYENTPTAVPQAGDVIIWGTEVGQYGHVAIFDRGTTSSFYSIDQNWPVDNGTGVLHEVKHNYNGVLGWLRPKQSPVVIQVPETITQEEKNILKFIHEQNATEGTVREAFGALIDKPNKDKQIQTLQARVLDLEKSQKDLSDRITALESNIEADLKTIDDWQKEVASARKQLDNANKSNQELITEKNQYKNWYETKCDELRKLDKMTAIEHIKYGFNLIFKRNQ